MAMIAKHLNYLILKKQERVDYSESGQVNESSEVTVIETMWK